MSLVFLEVNLGPGFALYFIGAQMLGQPWFWIITLIIAYFGFELIRARRRRK